MTRPCINNDNPHWLRTYFLYTLKAFSELTDPIELFVDRTYTNMIVLVFAVGLVLYPFISTKVEAQVADECKCSNSKSLFSQTDN